jgi:threonylcarbamoyladenosine tRNA methylthiotransferase MtaB
LNHKTFSLQTLGCRVNQYESSYVIEAMAQAGCHVVDSRRQADITLVHSCAVTSRASFETRQLLRRARRGNPNGLVIAMGCDANLEWERMASEGLATHVLGNREKFDIVRWVTESGTFQNPCVAVSDPRKTHAFREIHVHEMATGRTRAVMKVQDGCNAFCSYCIVPYTRGCSRSLSPSAVRSQLDRFLEHGFQEVVLSGIHLGQWGRDLATPLNLASLFRQLKSGPLPQRIRLSSLEPLEWTQELITELSRTPEICQHFHIPLQSGDDEILNKMQRPYGVALYRELIEDMHRCFPDAAIGADVLVGFPGETDFQFENTLSLLRELPLSYLHVFPFSARPGTPASTMKGATDGRTLKTRCRVLRELSVQKRREFAQKFMGSELEVLVEKQDPMGNWQGTSDNYLKITFPASSGLGPGSVVPVRLMELSSHGLKGEVRAP